MGAGERGVRWAEVEYNGTRLCIWLEEAHGGWIGGVDMMKVFAPDKL